MSNHREKARQALRAGGLLAEASPEWNTVPSMSLEEVQAAFARAGGKPLSEMVIEQREPKNSTSAPPDFRSFGNF